MRAVWLLVKWVLIPAVLAVIGYTIVGPRIGKVELNFSTGATQAEPHAVQTTSDPGPTTQNVYPAPDVDVKVSQATSERPRRRHNRARRRENKPVETPTVPATPPDNGGSGGATTTGGDPASNPGTTTGG